ncbi:MAG: O-antigen ligase family protein, partial [Planctomycetota bacterium]
MQSEVRRSAPSLICSLFLGLFLGILIALVGDLRLRWLFAVLVVMCVLFVLAFLRRPRNLLLALLIMCLPIGYNYHLSYRPGHIGISDGFTIEIMDSILFVLLLLWFYEERFKNYGKLNSFPLTTTPIALFLLACLLSFFNSNDVELSIYGFVESIKGFVFYFYIANNIKDEKDIKLVLISLQLSIALIGAICILEAALETNFNTAFESVTQDPYTTLFRSAGLSTPTLTAGYLAAIIPLASINYFFIKNNILKISLLISVTMALFGLLLTFTRAAWVSLAVGSVPLVFLLFRWRILKLRQVGLLILVIGTIAFFHHKNISLRFSEGLDNLYARYSIMLVAINMVKANPVLGVGLNTYQEEMDEYMPTSLPHHFM